jgi:hypothetical protein
MNKLLKFSLFVLWIAIGFAALSYYHDSEDVFFLWGGVIAVSYAFVQFWSHSHD